MKKQILLSFIVSLLAACAPESNTLKTENRIQVDELALSNLTANKWCQHNKLSGAFDYKWEFNKNLTATAQKLNAQTSAELFQWSITADNILTLKPGMLTVIFFKTVTYNYNVAELKRTMLWTEGNELTHFTECE